MDLKVNKLSKNQVELEIEVSKEEFNNDIEKAIDFASKDVEVKGFRKGNAPRDIVIEKVGMGKILNFAAEEAINKNYIEAATLLTEGKIEGEEKIEIVSQPEIEVTKIAKDNPFIFKARVYTLPEIDLPDYKKVAKDIKIEKVEVTEEEINRLKEQKENESKEKRRQEIINQIIKKVKLDIPDVLVKREQKNILEGTKRGVKQNLQLEFDEYLKKIGKTEEELLATFKDDAENRIKKYLALKEIAKQEKIEATEKDVTERLDQMFKGVEDKEKAKSEIDFKNMKNYYKEVIVNEKVFKFLEEIA